MTLAQSPPAQVHWSNDLTKATRFLLGIFTFIPSDAESIEIADNYTMIEELFDVGVHAKSNGAVEIADFAGDVLISWGIKGAKFDAGWSILERSLTALVVLALLRSANAEADIADVATRLRAALERELVPLLPSTFERASEALRALREDLPDRAYTFTRVEAAMRYIEKEDLQKGLAVLAEQLEQAGSAAVQKP